MINLHLKNLSTQKTKNILVPNLNLIPFSNIIIQKIETNPEYTIIEYNDLLKKEVEIYRIFKNFVLTKNHIIYKVKDNLEFELICQFENVENLVCDDFFVVKDEIFFDQKVSFKFPTDIKKSIDFKDINFKDNLDFNKNKNILDCNKNNIDLNRKDKELILKDYIIILTNPNTLKIFDLSKLFLKTIELNFIKNFIELKGYFIKNNLIYLYKQNEILIINIENENRKTVLIGNEIIGIWNEFLYTRNEVFLMSEFI